MQQYSNKRLLKIEEEKNETKLIFEILLFQYVLNKSIQKYKNNI